MGNQIFKEILTTFICVYDISPSSSCSACGFSASNLAAPLGLGMEEGRRGVRAKAAAGIEGPAARRGDARVLHGVPDPGAAALLQATVGEVTQLTVHES